MTAMLEYPPDLIKQADAPELAAAKMALCGAVGADYRPARVEMLRLRYEALTAHISMLSARHRLATVDLNTVREELRIYAPDVLHELEGGRL